MNETCCYKEEKPVIPYQHNTGDEMKMLGKGLRMCCTRIKRTSPTAPPPPQNYAHAPSSSSCSFVLKNFNSLYDPASAPVSDSETLAGFGSGSTSLTLTTTTADDDDPAASDSEPDMSSVFASRRLLMPASTGRSNSIIDDSDEEGDGPVGFGAVPTLSPDPYEDFKRSMEEMVAALGLVDGGDHRHRRQQQLSGAHQMRLQELLLCYLALNRKNAHKYIVGAFSDVLRGLTASGD